MSRIGLFISTFDPPTYNDMQMASKILYDITDISQLWFIAYGKAATPLKNREEMLIYATQAFFPETQAIQCKQIENADKSNSNALLEIYQFIQSQYKSKQFLLICYNEQVNSEFGEKSELLGQTICINYSTEIPLNAPRYLVKQDEFISVDFKTLHNEIINRLKKIQRASNIDCCKVLNLIPKLVLQYIIANGLYLN